jgi:dihydroxyacid dehydratase/phosphogluconate dehydratase
MDAKANLNNQRPSRHVTEGRDRAPHRGTKSFGPSCEVIADSVALKMRGHSNDAFIGLAGYSKSRPGTMISMCDRLCRTAGERILDFVKAGIGHRDIVARKAGENAATFGGSTNAALHAPAIAHECGIEFTLFDVAEVFKRTPYVAHLKPGGRYVAKDLFESAGVVAVKNKKTREGDTLAIRYEGPKGGPGMCEMLATTAALYGQGTGEAIALFTDGRFSGVDVSLGEADLAARKRTWRPRESEFTSGYLWKYAQQVGPALNGVVTHPGGAAEKLCYADI